MTPGQRPSALLEIAQIAVPAPVSFPPVLKAHGGGEAFFHGGEASDLALDLDDLGYQSGAPQRRVHARLVVGEARDLARLPPLVHVKRHHPETASGPQRA